MNRRWSLRGTLFLLLVSANVVPFDFSWGGEISNGEGDQRWNVEEHEELLRYARGTWHSFDSMTGPSGLPADRLLMDDRGKWKRSKQTSPTDIASYLWSTLAAQTLGLIDSAEADPRLGATLATLGRMERDHGFFFNQYNPENGERIHAGRDEKHPPPRPFLSSVDNGWLAAALMMVGNSHPALRERAEALLGPMDFGFFHVPFDPTDHVKRPGQFHGGYYVDDRTFSPFYGMLNTEPRIVSYIAIARRHVPPEHYFHLFRTLPEDRGRQRQVPQGEVRTYLGVSVFEGHYKYRGLEIVPSWGGSMFEALMVPLFVPEERWAPRSWGVNHPLYVRAQIEEGLEVRRFGYWGFSPCGTPEGGYQTYGVNDLGTDLNGYLSYEVPSRSKPNGDKPNGPAREGVVTPHASFLALAYAPREALDNLRGLIKRFDILGPQGFHDSVNVTTGEVSRSVLSLDQGMIMAAIANALAEDAMRRAFSDGLIEGSIRPLIATEAFTAKVIAKVEHSR